MEKFRPVSGALRPIEFFNDYLLRSPWVVRLLNRFILWLFVWLPPLMIGRLKPFHKLSEEDREIYLQKWAKHRLYWVRQAFTLIKVMVCFGGGGEPEFQRAMGYVKPNQSSALGGARRDTLHVTRGTPPSTASRRGRPGWRGTAPSMAGTMQDEADFIVVGSGAAGATFARTAARAGASVILLEEGPAIPTAEFETNLWRSMRRAWRSGGMTAILGETMIPYLQGRCVGGTTTINSGISWRIPDDVYPLWEKQFGVRLDRNNLETCFDEIERDLQIGDTPERVWGENNRLMKVGTEKLGFKAHPTRRNIADCEGLSLCQQGCPKGHKLSMELTYVPDAVRLGARLWQGVRADRILTETGRAAGVEGVGPEGPVRFGARKGVVLAASAIQSPLLIRASGLARRYGHVGLHFQAHPGIGIAASFDRPVRMWEGATQGYECDHFRPERFKVETLALPMELMMVRLPGAGKKWLERLSRFEHYALWGIQVRCRAEGTVRSSSMGPMIRYTPNADDCATFARSAYEVSRMFFAAGARTVLTGIRGAPEEFRSADEAKILLELKPAPQDLQMAVTHMFGTCRMGPDPRSSVVGADFQVHDLKGLYVVDSSVFPTNLGVNPQEPIMGLAMLAAQGVAA